MKRSYIIPVLIVMLLSVTSCTGAGVGVGVYHHHHFGSWWGARPYYRDRIIVVPPGEIEPPLVATPLPSGPEHEIGVTLPEVDMPDMGMPDIDLGDLGD